MAEPTKRTSPKTSTRRRVSKRTPTKRTTHTGDSIVEGAEHLVEALDAEVRLRFSAAMLVAGAIIVVVLVLTAAASVNWLYAIVTIALAFAAGWLACRSAQNSRARPHRSA